MTDPFLELTELSLVWGPLELPEPALSFADDWKTQIYTPSEIADAILSVPGTSLIRAAFPDWNNWLAKWNEANRYISFDICACEIDPDNEIRPGTSIAWGGSGFTGRCLLSDVLKVWKCIQQRCPGVWLHDTDCQMYTPESFTRKFG